MIDAIICVSEPDHQIFNKCIDQLLKQDYLQNIIVVFPFSQSLKFSNVKIIEVKESRISCLAYARKLGLQKSSAYFICFIDADVILHKNHFNNLLQAYLKYKNIFKTKSIAIEGVLTTKNKYSNSFSLPYSTYKQRILKLGERGFTHNTLIPREVIINWNPPFTCAWEDYSITQFILNNDGKWIRFRQLNKSYHIRDYGLIQRTSWGTAGERIITQLSKKAIIFRSLMYIKRAILYPFILKDVRWTIFNIKLFISSLIGYFKYKNYIFLKKEFQNKRQ